MAIYANVTSNIEGVKCIKLVRNSTFCKKTFLNVLVYMYIYFLATILNDTFRIDVIFRTTCETLLNVSFMLKTKNMYFGRF